MKKVRSGAPAWLKRKVSGAFRIFADVLVGGILLVAMIAVEGLVSMVLGWFARLVDNTVLTEAVHLLDAFLLIVDIGLYVWWVIVSTYRAASRATKEK